MFPKEGSEKCQSMTLTEFQSRLCRPRMYHKGWYFMTVSFSSLPVGGGAAQQPVASPDQMKSYGTRKTGFCVDATPVRLLESPKIIEM